MMGFAPHLTPHTHARTTTHPHPLEHARPAPPRRAAPLPPPTPADVTVTVPGTHPPHQTLHLRFLSIPGPSLVEICGMRDLVDLDLAFCQLARLPPCVSALGRLTCLTLSHNRLRELPPALGALTGLVTCEARCV